eukprot:Tbor_TRINITY_DN4953_c0_g1::TRINITY_DN4953_c0_g1_i1::g.9778::m.9778
MPEISLSEHIVPKGDATSRNGEVPQEIALPIDGTPLSNEVTGMMTVAAGRSGSLPTTESSLLHTLSQLLKRRRHDIEKQEHLVSLLRQHKINRERSMEAIQVAISGVIDQSIDTPDVSAIEVTKGIQAILQHMSLYVAQTRSAYTRLESEGLASATHLAVDNVSRNNNGDLNNVSDAHIGTSALEGMDRGVDSGDSMVAQLLREEAEALMELAIFNERKKKEKRKAKADKIKRKNNNNNKKEVVHDHQIHENAEESNILNIDMACQWRCVDARNPTSIQGRTVVDALAMFDFSHINVSQDNACEKANCQTIGEVPAEGHDIIHTTDAVPGTASQSMTHHIRDLVLSREPLPSWLEDPAVSAVQDDSAHYSDDFEEGDD